MYLSRTLEYMEYIHHFVVFYPRFSKSCLFQVCKTHSFDSQTCWVFAIFKVQPRCNMICFRLNRAWCRAVRVCSSGLWISCTAKEYVLETRSNVTVLKAVVSDVESLIRINVENPFNHLDWKSQGEITHLKVEIKARNLNNFSFFVRYLFHKRLAWKF